MKTKKIMLVAGARPNFMKIVPIIKALRQKQKEGYQKKLKYCLVHTGQHYDFNMSEVFFKDLEIPRPNFFLETGSASHAVQTARIMTGFERVLLRYKPDLVMLVGDVNSTLACALVASKIGFSLGKKLSKPLIAHVEAGLRSFDRAMTEEINRVLTDHLVDFLFTTCKEANENLEKEGIPKEKIFFVGNVMIDTFIGLKGKIEKSSILKDLNLKTKEYAVTTLHRPSNVDNKKILRNLMKAFREISTHIPIIFPVHPRTAAQIMNFNLPGFAKHMKIIKPLGYRDFSKLWMNAKFVITDSGGIQEETTYAGVPCLTVRENTERPITVEVGTNTLVSLKRNALVRESLNIIKNGGKIGKIPKLWDGKAAQRIVNIILKKIIQ